MADQARDGVVIPGYQPVEMLGRTPSFGVWVRAIQTRLDRHVLLKLLSGSAAPTQEAFSREIAALVRLDGNGVLRVIDEGAVGAVRFLVVDEAGGELPARLETGDWHEVARTYEDLYRQFGADQAVLLPLPPDTLRRLPSGHFVTGDLGWVVGVGEPLPAHPQVPTEWHGQPAELWHNAKFLGGTLKELSSKHGNCPRPLSQEFLALERLTESKDTVDPLAASPLSSVAKPQQARVPAWAWLLGVVVMLAAGGWLASAFWEQDKPSDTPTEVGDQQQDPGPESPSEPERPQVEVVDPPQEQDKSGDAEARFSEILGPPQENDEDDAEFAVVIDEKREQQLTQLIEEFPDTEAARRSARILEVARLASVQTTWHWWQRTRGPAQTALRAGNFALVEQTLGATPRPNLPTSIVTERAYLENSLVGRERALTQQLDIEWAALCQSRKYAQVQADFAKREASWSSRQSEWVAAWKARLADESQRYQAAASALAVAERNMFQRAEEGAWEPGLAAIGELAVGPDFPELSERSAAWSSRLRRAFEVARTFDAGLRKLEESGKNLTFALVGEDPVRGKVTGFESATSFVIKVDGRRSNRTLSWRSLRRASFTDVIERNGASVDPDDLLLLVFFLGDVRRSATALVELDPAPEWASDVLRVADSRRVELLTQRLALAGEHAGKGQWEKFESTLQDLLQVLTVADFDRERKLFEGWFQKLWNARGPGVAFPGARTSEFSDGVLSLTYDFRQEGAAQDWQRGDRRTKVEEKRGTLLLRGSVWLVPAEAWGKSRSDIFQGALETHAEMQARNPESPNLNVILWSQLPLAHESGVLFGLGFHPQKLHQLPLAPDKSPVLLPANVIGVAAEIERGLQAHYVSVNPKVARRSTVIHAKIDGDACRLGWKDSDQELGSCQTSYSKERRRGTVQFRSYASSVLIRSVRVAGRLNSSWWEAWVQRAAQRDVQALREQIATP